MGNGFGWIGRCEHGGAVLMIAELGDTKRDKSLTAKSVAEGIRDGLAMERMTMAAVRATRPLGCEACRNAKPAKKTAKKGSRK